MIDKLFLSRFYFNNKGSKVSTQFKDGTHEYYANRLLSNYIALLKDTGSKENENKNRTAHSNHASIDGDTKLLKDIIKDLEDRKEQEALDPYSPYSLWANAQTKTEFITGKFGIGPFALNNNSHILTMLYGVKFKDEGFLAELGMNRLDLSQDRYGNSILSWLSGLINAHVDVAKDPYISRLNVNTYTYNLVNLMVRTGFGRDTFYFTTQPLMVEMAKAYSNAASQYGSESSRSKSRRQKDAVDEVVFNFVKHNFKLPEDVTSLKQADKVLNGYFSKVRGIDVDAAIESLLSKGDDVLHQISKNAIPMDGKARMYNVGGVMMSAYEVQYLVYRTKKNFEPYERSLSDLVKYSKIDTKKQGKNITEQMAYAKGVKDLFEPANGDYGLFEDLKDYYEKSYIKQKTKNALDLFTDIMGSFTIESTQQFQVQVNKVLSEIGEKNPSADMRKAASLQIMNYIRAGFFNKWAEENGIDIKGLITGENTISDRLEDIRIKIMTDPAFADMRASDGSIKNYLLAALVQGFHYKENNPVGPLNAGTRPATHSNAKFVKTLNFMDADHVNDDDMAEAWDELLNDPTHPELLSFARDLIMYAYITSGGNSGNNLFKFIPNSWKLDSYRDNDVRKSYAQYMLDQLYMYLTSKEELPLDLHEIILNNWFDDRFVPTVKLDGFNGYYTGRYYYEGNNKPNMTIPVLLIKKNANPDTQDDDRYIKVMRNSPDPHTPRRYTVYKAIAYTSDGKLIYAMVDPKGNKFPRDVIYEMRRNDNDVKESATVAAFSKDFTELIKIVKGAMGMNGTDLSLILGNFINKLRSTGLIGDAVAMINIATKDQTLKEILKSAVFIQDLKSESTNITESPAETKQEAEENGAKTYKSDNVDPSTEKTDAYKNVYEFKVGPISKRLVDLNSNYTVESIQLLLKKNGLLKRHNITKIHKSILLLAQKLGVNIKFADPVDDVTTGECTGSQITLYIDPEHPDFLHTFFHELLHACVSGIINAKDENLTPIQLHAKQKLMEIYDQTKDQFEAYGFKNIHEFVSELMSNTKFQKELGEHQDMSSWEKVKQSLRKAIAAVLNTLFTGSMYSETNHILILNLLDPSNIIVEFDNEINVTNQQLAFIESSIRQNDAHKGIGDRLYVIDGNGIVYGATYNNGTVRVYATAEEGSNEAASIISSVEGYKNRLSVDVNTVLSELGKSLRNEGIMINGELKKC